MENIATSGLSADITFLLDLPLQASLARRTARKEDRIEAEGIDFLSRVSKGFHSLALQKDWVIVPADRSKQDVSISLQSEIQRHFESL